MRIKVHYIDGGSFIMESDQLHAAPCPVPTDPGQELSIVCAHCGKPIDFRSGEVYIDKHQASYVCRDHAGPPSVERIEELASQAAGDRYQCWEQIPDRPAPRLSRKESAFARTARLLRDMPLDNGNS